MTIQSIEAELRRAERRTEKLRKQLEDRKRKQFTAIPAKYGFKSMDAFIAALSPYAPGRLKSTPAKSAASSKKSSARPGYKRYTDQQKAGVKAALQKGDKTVREIAKEKGISEYAIIDWKEAWGLVKHRKTKKKAAAKKK